MYDFYYHKLQPYYNNNVKLHYMDTDSFILIKTEDLIIDLEDFKDDFDFSELDENHELYDTISKKVIGKMKIETSPIIELDNFVALRSKSYSFSYQATQEATQKTVQKSKQNGIQHTTQNKQFINSLFNSQTTTATNYSIRSDAHNLTVQKQDNLALNPFDDKCVYLNPIQSLSWDKHTQKGDCPCIYCLKLIGLYYKELSINGTIGMKKYTITFDSERKNESSRSGPFIIITLLILFHIFYNKLSNKINKL